MRQVIKETVTIERVKSEIVFCDICGKDVRDGMDSSYDVREVEIYIRNGSRYPEGGWGEEYKADVCLECAEEKVVPVLTALGCKAQWKKWDS